MISLPEVTLVCVDTAHPVLALRAMQQSLARVRFGRAVLVTGETTIDPGEGGRHGIEVVAGAAISSRDDYSRYVVKALHRHVATTHALLIQWDGFVVNPGAWSPEFLGYDYIGARWPWHRDGLTVGNGGFSLRSRRLLEVLADPEIVVEGNEDETICRRYRPLLEARYGIRFAPEPVAERFAFEVDYPVGVPFGFHGLFNFWRVVAAEELAGLCSAMSDAIARSPQMEQLARNYANLGRWREAARTLQRILQAVSGRADLEALAAHCARMAESAPAARRNDPCPCGSGRRYKHCHGAEGMRANAAAAPRPASLPPGAAVLAIGVPPPAPAPTTLEELQQALALHQQGAGDAAEAIYRRILAREDHPIAEHYLGVRHYERGDFAAALPLLERSTARAGQTPDFPMNLGVARLAAGDEAAAIEALAASLRLAPRHAAAHNNLGLALQAVNRLPEAIAAFRTAIALASQYAEAHWNLSLALLASGDYAEGWREYEWRRRIRALAGATPVPPLPYWDGALRPGLRLRVLAEQGLGDAIQFVRFVPLLARAGVRVQLECKPALRRLFGSLPGVERLLDPFPGPPGGLFGGLPGEPPGDPLRAAAMEADAVVHLLGLPGVLGVDARSIPAAAPYLSAPADEIARWRARLPGLPADLRVGIAWAGNRAHRNDRNRSCPFAHLTTLARIPGIRLISLQVGDTPPELAPLAAEGGITTFGAELRDFADTAALVSALDLVVSVDTSVAHLAGALARPLIVMLPFAPDWRWQLERADSPWYPTARLVRAPRPRDWEAVIAAVATVLDHEARNKSARPGCS